IERFSSPPALVECKTHRIARRRDGRNAHRSLTQLVGISEIKPEAADHPFEEAGRMPCRPRRTACAEAGEDACCQHHRQAEVAGHQSSHHVVARAPPLPVTATRNQCARVANICSARSVKSSSTTSARGTISLAAGALPAALGSSYGPCMHASRRATPPSSVPEPNSCRTALPSQNGPVLSQRLTALPSTAS